MLIDGWLSRNEFNFHCENLNIYISDGNGIKMYKETSK
jgi:hypothetical protein